MIQIFGIRHHGPGSARTLLAGLEDFQPDCILIEGPPDADALIPMASHPEMEPPVAILVFNPKQLAQASFYPFAEFSPEWQAMLFGNRAKTAVRFMDLPARHAFALKEEVAENQQLALKLNDESPSPEEELLQLDPFSRIAKIAGYADPERWWDAFFERHAVHGSRFTDLLELMAALREDKLKSGKPETRETLLREAWMRKTIREAEKEGFKKIAVVCGAWHAPALSGFGKIKASEDANLLKGLKKVPVSAVWVPWSFDRLAASSGYGAGVISPGWYRILFKNHEKAVIEWFAKAASLLRAEGLDTSSAHLIEAVRLAETLAVLRKTQVPGIEELRESASTVLCEGAAKPLELIENQLIIGEILGKIPASATTSPLKVDFETEAKTCRLEISSREETIELDLRKNLHPRKSALFHRTRLLGLNWATELKIGGGKQGRFHENWKTRWQPDFEIQLILQGTWGSTVSSAAENFVREKISKTDSIADLSDFLEPVLKADLGNLMPVLLKKLSGTAAVSTDILILANVILKWVNTKFYGDARKFDPGELNVLLEKTVPRVCIGLPAACQNIDLEVAETVLTTIKSFNRAIAIEQRKDYDALWEKSLRDLAGQPEVSNLLAGFAARVLLDKQIVSPEDGSREMHFRLSSAAEELSAAAWLEGFLHGSGLLLIHQESLWRVLDEWLCGLEFERFRQVLPLLRRTFSKFEAPEREKLLDLAKSENGFFRGRKLDLGLDAGRVEIVSPTLKMVFS